MLLVSFALSVRRVDSVGGKRGRRHEKSVQTCKSYTLTDGLNYTLRSFFILAENGREIQERKVSRK